MTGRQSWSCCQMASIILFVSLIALSWLVAIDAKRRTAPREEDVGDRDEVEFKPIKHRHKSHKSRHSKSLFANGRNSNQAHGGDTLDYSQDPSRVTAVRPQAKISSVVMDSYAVVATLDGLQARLKNPQNQLESLLGPDGRAIPLSEQMLIDCARGVRTNGVKFFEYVSLHGIAPQSSYLDTGNQTTIDDKCDTGRMKNNMMKGMIEGVYIYLYETISNEWLMEKLRSFGPFMVKIRLDDLKDGTCTPMGHLIHSNGKFVTLVGYGTRNGVDYFKFKNAWGTEWGDKGYGYRERSKTCLVWQRAVIPKVIGVNYPPTISHESLDYSEDPSRVTEPGRRKTRCDNRWVDAFVATLEGQQAKLGLLDSQGRAIPLSGHMLIDCVWRDCYPDEVKGRPTINRIPEKFNEKREHEFYPHKLLTDLGVATKSWYNDEAPHNLEDPYMCKTEKLGANMMKGLIEGIDSYPKNMLSNEWLIDKLKSFGPFMVLIHREALSDYDFEGQYNQIYIGDYSCFESIYHQYREYVTLVGYGTKDGVEYFKYKYWKGDRWGDKGYGYVKRKEECRMFSHAMIPRFKNATQISQPPPPSPPSLSPPSPSPPPRPRPRPSPSPPHDEIRYET